MEAQKQENKLRSDLRKAAWQYEIVREWVEEELQEQQGVPGVPPVTINMYVSARVFSQLKEKDLQNLDLQNLQKPPRWVKEKVSLVLWDIYKQGKEKEKEENTAEPGGRLSFLFSEG